MKPFLSSWPAKKRNTFFPIFAVGIFLLTFLIIAFATQIYVMALLIPPILGVAGAWALVGWPTIQTKDGRPLIEPQHKPYLFFVLAPFFAIIFYPILGLIGTQVGLPLAAWMTIVYILLSIVLAVALAYSLVGVPNLYASLRRQYALLPPERRPYLFFPISVILFLIIYLTLGVASTRMLDSVSPASSMQLLNMQVLILAPVCLALACLIAWLLVGIPKPTRSLASSIPKLTGKHRPRAFLATAFFGGIILTLAIGALLTYNSPLPPTAVLGLAILLGFALSVGLAALAWGTPAQWRRYEDYDPSIHPRLRLPMLMGISFAVGVAIAIGIGLADIDLFWGVLAGGFGAVLTLLFLTGTHRRIAARRSEPTLVPDLPDGMKPMILIPAWLIISGIIFAVLTYVLPRLVPINLLIGLIVGLLTTFLLLEQPLLHQLRQDRQKEKEKRRAWEARRKERLAEAEKSS